MKQIDLTNQRFGKLLVLERDFSKTNGTYWKCKCDCGRIISTRKDTLTRKDYPKIDCGCGLQERNSKAHLKDETGNKYGKLTVLYRVPDLRKGEARWHCKCECGNECDVSGIHLRNGTVASCGCKKYESKNGINEVGNRTSCGCEKSLGEKEIVKLLSEAKIPYKREYTFEDLLSDKGVPLRFDFGILDSNDKLQYLIEFDGIQHFKQIGFNSKPEKFERNLLHDKMKNEYCEKHGIKLIRIPYYKLETLTIKDLIERSDN